MRKNSIAFVGAVLALALAASLAQAEGLEKISAAGADAITQAQASIVKTIAEQKKQFAEKAAKCTPNSADPYVPRTDPWGQPECLPGWSLVNRDYISPSCPGVVINPSCVRGGGHERASIAAAVAQVVSPKGDGRGSSLQSYVDSLAPKLGKVKDGESFSRVYGPALEDALGWGVTVDSPMFGDRFSITVRFPSRFESWDVDAAGGVLTAPGEGGPVTLKVWAIQPQRRGGGRER